MIIVNCGLKQDDIVKIVENIEVENRKVFKYIKKEGLKLFFECSLENQKNAALIAKQSIKNTELGKVLYFGVGVQ